MASVVHGEPALALLRAARFGAPHELRLVREHAAAVGCLDAMAFLADLQQATLVPFTGPAGPGMAASVTPLAADSTLTGRASSHLEVLTQPGASGRQRVWLPLLDGADRLGVLMLVLDAGTDATAAPPLDRLRRFAAVVSELIVTKSAYGDTPVRLRRTADLRMAAEL